MRHPRHHGPLGLTLAGALAVSVAGCGSDGADGATSPGSGSGSSSSSSSSSPEWDKDHALAEAKDAIHARDKHKVNEPLSKKQDAEFATPKYVRLYNKELQKIKDQQVTKKGSITTNSVHLKQLDPDAVGGPDLTVIACSTSTVRYYGPKGKDVTGDPKTGKPLPKEPQQNAHLVSLTTTDKGKTWKIADTQQILGETAKKSPCDVSE